MTKCYEVTFTFTVHAHGENESQALESAEKMFAGARAGHDLDGFEAIVEESL